MFLYEKFTSVLLLCKKSNLCYKNISLYLWDIKDVSKAIKHDENFKKNESVFYEATMKLIFTDSFQNFNLVDSKVEYNCRNLYNTILYTLYESISNNDAQIFIHFRIKSKIICYTLCVIFSHKHFMLWTDVVLFVVLDSFYGIEKQFLEPTLK